MRVIRSLCLSESRGRRPRGRQKGVPNKVTQEIRELATRLVTDPVYLRNLQSRLRFGECPAGVEIMLHHYTYGAPAKTLLVKDQRAPLAFLTFHPIGIYDPLAGVNSTWVAIESIPKPVVINVNAAAVEDLSTLPMIGHVRASAIVRYRSEHGPFAAAEDLQRVHGIGPGTLNAIRNLVTTGR